VPIHSGNVGSAAVEKVLAIVKIEDGIVALRLRIIARREIYDQAAGIS
jgi:hypothetical protein